MAKRLDGNMGSKVATTGNFVNAKVTKVEKAMTSAEAIKLAGLDFEVSKVELLRADGGDLKNVYATVRSDTKEALGLVKGKYKITQNKEAFEIADDFLKVSEEEVKYNCAGALFGGRKVFLEVELPNFEIFGDEFASHFFVVNSHDGSSALRAGLTNKRIICNNMISAMIKSAPRVWNCRHTASLEEKKEEAMKALGYCLDYTNKLKETAEEWNKVVYDEDKFVKDLCKEAAKKSERLSVELADKIPVLLTEKDDLQWLTANRGWKLYQAVADFNSNAEPVKRTRTYEDRKINESFEGSSLLAIAQGLIEARM